MKMNVWSDRSAGTVLVYDLPRDGEKNTDTMMLIPSESFSGEIIARVALWAPPMVNV